MPATYCEIPGVQLWRLVGSSGECRNKSESRWRQIDAKRTPCDAMTAYSEEICKTADFSACCTGTTSVAVPVQPARTRLVALGLALVPVQEPVYRYKRVGRGLNGSFYPSFGSPTLPLSI
uniref:Uncharacterized protein n=1 Tax=Ananas comosus var. bracteatus TaxID=296719 RepID=A0A6V7QW61_ANACO